MKTKNKKLKEKKEKQKRSEDVNDKYTCQQTNNQSRREVAEELIRQGYLERLDLNLSSVQSLLSTPKKQSWDDLNRSPSDVLNNTFKEVLKIPFIWVVQASRKLTVTIRQLEYQL